MKIQCIIYYFWEGLGNKNCDYICILKMRRYQNSTNDLFILLHIWVCMLQNQVTHDFLIFHIRPGKIFDSDPVQIYVEQYHFIISSSSNILYT